MCAMLIRYEKFEKKMLDVMIQKEYKPDIDDRLRQAFLVSVVSHVLSSAIPCVLPSLAAESRALSSLAAGPHQAIDKQRKGWIDEATMTKFLTTKGTPFRSKEVEGFMSVAKDPDTGRIYYDDYIAAMMKDLEDMEAEQA